MLIADAEIKAKSQREKLQSKVNDQIKANELEMAELKIKQVAEFKAAQESLEAQWQKENSESARAFLNEARESCEKLIYGSKLNSGLKMRLLTALEESLHRHFAVTAAPATTLHEDDEAVTMLRPVAAPAPNAPLSVTAAVEEFDKDEDPTPISRFNRKNLSAMAAFAIVAAIGAALWMGSGSDVPTAPPQQAVVAITPPPEAVPVTQPQPQPQPQPVQAAPRPVQAVEPAVIPSKTPVAVKSVIRKPERKPVSVRPAVVPQKVDPDAIGWGDVVAAEPLEASQNAAIVFLRSIKVDSAKVRRYRQLETRFARSIERLNSRSPAYLRDQQRLEAQFERDAKKILGSTVWAKFVAFRDNYWR